MSPSPCIVFCITCKGRAQHIERTLPQNLVDNRDYANIKFVLVDYNSPDHLIPYLKEHHREAIESGRLVVYSYKQPGPFKMAHAKNLAHRLGILEGGEILCNLDADNFTGPGFAGYIAEQFAQSENIFLWARMVKEGPKATPRGINGRLVVTRNAFWITGGYDEQFATWSPDDKDFHLRLRRLGLMPREIEHQFLNAIVHNDKIRFREYRHVSTHANCEDVSMESVSSSDNTVCNFGQFGVGTVYRNFGAPVQLAPVPTRVFGIGMHKTATTSLHAALTLLGYSSAHWQSAHWAKQIWEEMQTWGRSRTLERHYALSDLPIPLLYRQLDQAYPGSKFILTKRDPARWIESVRNHWNPDHNRYRAAWDTDAFTHRVHRELYGRKTFDAETFLNRYRQHNEEVDTYFESRPKDLLVMEMDQAPGWQPLCEFLGQPIPQGEYPRKFVTVRGLFHGKGEGI